MTQANQTIRPLLPQFKALEGIQELDLKIDQLKKSQAALPESLKTLDQSLARLNLSMTVKTSALGEIEKVQRQTQAARDLNRDRLARSETRIQSVQNSHEYQAVNKENEQLKKLTTTLDEQSKKSEGDSEAIKKDLADLTAQFEKIKAERDEKASALSSQNGKFDEEIGALMANRAQFSAQVDKPLLAQYDRIRKARMGLGFVPALAGRCKGCNMMVPPQLFNEIRKLNTAHACPSCHRILFAPEGS
jgi:predicted  nucleic acid-binding Zn-ribbon protein